VTTLTVFTPTYNRAHTLPRVFDSLQRQTSRDFRWLVVDDGSSDNTETLVKQWQARADFKVEYVFQQNRGKHSAHNAAVARATTELLMILDSDDELLPRAVEIITSTWRGTTAAERAGLAGIWTLCADPAGNVIGTPWPQDVFDSSLQDLRYRHKVVDKEMLPTFVTDVLKQHPFPRTPPGSCPYIPESYVWMAITRTRRLRFLNVPCRIYHPGEGLSTAARGEYALSHCTVFAYLSPLASDLEWFGHWPRFFIMNAIQAARYAIFSRRFWQLARPLSWKAQALLLCAAPVSMALIARDFLTGRIGREISGARDLQKAHME
jgi:hypothetical protein